MLNKRFEAIFQVVIKLCAEAYNMHRSDIPAVKKNIIEITTSKAIDFRQSTAKNCTNYGKEICWANLIGTNSVSVKAESERFTAAGSRFGENLKFENFASSFRRLRQGNEP